MFWLKSCPRCHGDLYEKADIYGPYIDCLQCGHYLTAIEDEILRSEDRQSKTFALPSNEPIRVLADVTA